MENRDVHRSFLQYANGLWLKVAIGLALLSTLVYLLHQPGEPANGGTWLGYTLGTIGALLILWLTWYGVRKRDYRSNLGTVKGWLSAHVYLGGSLLIVATLHTGFQFGLNVHTLAYVLMLLVIASGVFGVIAYVRFPSRISVNREGRDRQALLKEIVIIDERCMELAGAIGEPVKKMLSSSIELFRVGGGPLHQLAGRDSSRLLEPNGSGLNGKDAWTTRVNPLQTRLLYLLAGELSRSRDPEQAGRLQELIDQVGLKRQATRRLLADIRMQGILEIWLYVHVPLTVALLAALLAHVIAVFAYW